MQLVLQIDKALVSALGKGLFETKDGGCEEGSNGQDRGVNGAFDGVRGRGGVVDWRRGLAEEHAEAAGEAFEAEEVVSERIGLNLAKMRGRLECHQQAFGGRHSVWMVRAIRACGALDNRSFVQIPVVTSFLFAAKFPGTRPFDHTRFVSPETSIDGSLTIYKQASADRHRRFFKPGYIHRR